ncbi:hypothetical protein GQX73_g6397 [Xylaria multiplex]|uniref:Argonaute siRNA chaperone complex subunit Arb1 n=1 Tax=Xylaria multiplex TaxID=323545 RepID=A0A7C8IRH3_9PEZI|nr:hypothetical protein GQX73_g6397 [Xylaria multiplex]
MAELPADTPSQHSQEPMATQIEVTQPPKTDITSIISQQDDSSVPHMACGVDGAANKAKSEADESTGGDMSAFEGSGIGDLTTGATEGVSGRGEAKKKKKRSKKPGKSRRKITGFEEYYADVPTTPMEAVEKKKLYDPARPFSNRIEECIQRFRARRRLDPLRADMFNKYLFLGGVDSSQRQFTGISKDTDAMTEADSEKIRVMTAVDFIGGKNSRFYDGSDAQNWEVDFEAVVKGFLSRTITDWCMYDGVLIQKAADLIKNFLNYILMQDVCPEYTSNIVAARKICDIAPIELRYIHELTLELPGDFNRAARSLFCEGRVEQLDKGENDEVLDRFRLTIFVWSLSKKAEQSKQKLLKTGDLTTIKVVSTMDKTYEILGIERPRHKDKKMVNEKLAEMKMNRKLKPAGFIRVIPAIIAHGWGNMPRPEEVDFSNAEEEEFLLEDELLAKLEVGMKMSVTVCELNVGLRFIKEVHELRVSFDTFLPQYLMTNWKDPAPNDRPPPSVNDPHCEEKAMGEAMVDDE